MDIWILVVLTSITPMMAVIVGYYFAVRRSLERRDDRLLIETRTIRGDIEALQGLRSSEAEERKRHHFLSREGRVLYYLNTSALEDLASSSQPLAITGERKVANKRTNKFGISFGQLPFLSPELGRANEESEEWVVKQKMTESFNYHGWERTMLETRRLKMGLEDFEAEDITELDQEVEAAIDWLKERGVGISDEVSASYREEKRGKEAAEKLSDIRSLPLFLMIGEFTVELLGGAPRLTYRHPVSDYLPAGQVAKFRMDCDAKYIRQSVFSSGQLPLAVLARPIRVEENGDFTLHALPVSIYSQ